MKKKSSELTPAELAMFFDSMSFLIRAGIIANEAPEIIASDLDKGNLKTVCQNLTKILEDSETDSLSSAMKQLGAFPAYAIKMFYLAEIAGRLETTCELLGRFYLRQNIINQNIRSAFMGPLLLLVTMCVVLVFLIFYILPVFHEVFHSLGYAQENTMAIASFASQVILVITSILLLFIVLLTVGFLIPKTRNTVMQLVNTFPPIKKILYTISVYRLTQSLSMLLASGIDGETSLGYITPLVSDAQIKANLPSCREKVESGKDLGVALVETNILHGFEAKMLLSAARSGQTSVVMERLADYYNESANKKIEAFISIIEPILVTILSLSIGVILLSVMFPLIGIMNSIG